MCLAIPARIEQLTAEDSAIINLGGKLAPQIVELPYWHAVALVNGGRVQEALPIFKEVFRREPKWRSAARRLAKVNQLPNDEATLKLIEAQ